MPVLERFIAVRRDDGTPVVFDRAVTPHAALPCRDGEQARRIAAGLNYVSGYFDIELEPREEAS